MPYGGQYHGPEAVAENVFGPVTNDFDDFDVTPEEILADGDRVVVLTTYTGTRQGERQASSRCRPPTCGPFATARSPTSASWRTPRPCNAALAVQAAA